MQLLKKLNRIFKHYKYKRRRKNLATQTAHIVTQISAALNAYPDQIPVIVVSYNNGIYVQNTVKQLNNFGITPIIIDNNSTDQQSRATLSKLESQGLARIVWSQHNFGHMVGFLEPIYNALPEVFAYTDPDLQFNNKLPADFLVRLASLTAEFHVFKAGFALSLEPHGTFKAIKIKRRGTKPFLYEEELPIQEYESRFWRYQLQYNELELYPALIDTTFAVYRKSNFSGEFYDGIRVAGNYTAIHLPWYEELDLFNEKSRMAYREGNRSTTWS